MVREQTQLGIPADPDLVRVLRAGEDIASCLRNNIETIETELQKMPNDYEFWRIFVNAEELLEDYREMRSKSSEIDEFYIRENFPDPGLIEFVDEFEGKEVYNIDDCIDAAQRTMTAISSAVCKYRHPAPRSLRQ